MHGKNIQKGFSSELQLFGLSCMATDMPKCPMPQYGPREKPKVDTSDPEAEAVTELLAIRRM